MSRSWTTINYNYTFTPLNMSRTSIMSLSGVFDSRVNNVGMVAMVEVAWSELVGRVLPVGARPSLDVKVTNTRGLLFHLAGG